MSTTPVAQQVRQIAADIFNLPVEQITDQTSPQTLADWDSVEQLNLVLAMEARFGVQLDPQEIEQIRTIGDAIRIAETRVG
ncbi:MAG TPA: acyl carrier protein [Tepidisphaeraceae bacterium]|jgi:acyl carrier protein